MLQNGFDRANRKITGHYFDVLNRQTFFSIIAIDNDFVKKIRFSLLCRYKYDIAASISEIMVAAIIEFRERKRYVRLVHFSLSDLSRWNSERERSGDCCVCEERRILKIGRQHRGSNISRLGKCELRKTINTRSSSSSVSCGLHSIYTRSHFFHLLLLCFN